MGTVEKLCTQDKVGLSGLHTLIVLLFLLISLYSSSTWGQDFVCGFGLAPESESGQVVGARGHNPAFYRSQTIQPLVWYEAQMTRSLIMSDRRVVLFTDKTTGWYAADQPYGYSWCRPSGVSGANGDVAAPSPSLSATF